VEFEPFEMLPFIEGTKCCRWNIKCLQIGWRRRSTHLG